MLYQSLPVDMRKKSLLVSCGPLSGAQIVCGLQLHSAEFPCTQLANLPIHMLVVKIQPMILKIPLPMSLHGTTCDPPQCSRLLFCVKELHCR